MQEGRYFQFLWGWNASGSVQRGVGHSRTFNSFEDETREEWRSGRDGKYDRFQFLWGWNFYTLIMEMKVVKTFNSFEDETWYIVKWKGKLWCILSIPLRTKLLQTNRFLSVRFWSFNSFEDETRNEDHSHEAEGRHLSIPLRMKPPSLIPLDEYLFNFQFLWGWNEIKIIQNETEIIIFQFLWGWNWSTFILSFIL